MKSLAVCLFLALSDSSAAQSLANALQNYPGTTTFVNYLDDLSDVLANSSDELFIIAC